MALHYFLDRTALEGVASRALQVPVLVDLRRKTISVVCALVLIGVSNLVSVSGGNAQAGSARTYAQAIEIPKAPDTPASAPVTPSAQTDTFTIGEASAAIGIREGQLYAVVDLMEYVPILVVQTEVKVDQLVRTALQRLAEQWFAQERLKHSLDVTVNVITVIKRDEYQRPDIKSAIRHGTVKIRNVDGKPAEAVGALSFANLIALRSGLVQQSPPRAREQRTTVQAPTPQLSAQEIEARIASAREQIIFDELDFLHHPRTLSNIYPSFEPMRLRVNGADYFFRNDALVSPFAASGHRYGELRLSEMSGSVMYLPQRLDFTNTLGYAFKVRKTNPASRFFFRVYKNLETVATYEEPPTRTLEVAVHIGENWFTKLARKLLPPGPKMAPSAPGSEWQDIRVPFSELKFASVPRKLATRPTWRSGDDFLLHYEAEPGFVFAVEIGLIDAKPGDALYFDRLVVLRDDAGREVGELRGRVTPMANGTIVRVWGRGVNLTLAPDRDGNFRATLPANAGALEILAQVDKYLFAPSIGRYLEVGTHLPDLEIPTTNEGVQTFPADSAISTAIYQYEGKLGPHLRPRSHFATSVQPDPQVKKLSLFLEQRANRFGFLDRDRRFENPDLAYRVVHIGDSNFFGLYNDMRDTFWNQAESLLNIFQDRPVEIISATHHHSAFVNGWSQFQNFALEFKPDLVILPVFGPHVLNLAMEDFIRVWLSAGKGHPPSTMFNLDADGKLVTMERDPDWLLHRKVLSPEETSALRERLDWRQYYRVDAENMPNWARNNLDVIVAILKKFAAEARKSGTEVALVNCSDLGYLNETVEQENGVTFDPKLFEERLRDLAAKAEVTFVNLSPSIYADPPVNKHIYYIPRNGHWSSLGQHRVGEALADEIALRIGTKF